MRRRLMTFRVVPTAAISCHRRNPLPPTWDNSVGLSASGIGPVAHQPVHCDGATIRIYRRNPVARRQGGKLHAAARAALNGRELAHRVCMGVEKAGGPTLSRPPLSSFLLSNAILAIPLTIGSIERQLSNLSRRLVL